MENRICAASKVTWRIYLLSCFVVLCTIFLTAAWFLSKETFDEISPMAGAEKSAYVIHRTQQIPREPVIDLPDRSRTAESLLIAGLLAVALSAYGFEKLYHKRK